jgi:hypothetical protein
MCKKDVKMCCATFEMKQGLPHFGNPTIITMCNIKHGTNNAK